MLPITSALRGDAKTPAVVKSSPPQAAYRSFSSNQLPTAFERATHALPAVHSAA
jgi:hypothetical protein